MTPIRRVCLIALTLGLPLGACSSVTEAVKGPELSKAAYPSALVPKHDEVARSVPASPGSLWQVGSGSFFRGNRAQAVGDILTVQIDINDNAQLSNESATSRKSSTDNGFSHLLGLETVVPSAIDPAHLVTTAGNTSNDGSGTVKRSEAVSLTVAAVVTSVLPNGNLMIQGRQEVRINQELRELTVSGIVRQGDISANNTINHTQIAEARVSYGGRGDVSRVQKTPAGQALVEKFSPF